MVSRKKSFFLDDKLINEETLQKYFDTKQIIDSFNGILTKTNQIYSSTNQNYFLPTEKLLGYFIPQIFSFRFKKTKNQKFYILGEYHFGKIGICKDFTLKQVLDFLIESNPDQKYTLLIENSFYNNERDLRLIYDTFKDWIPSLETVKEYSKSKPNNLELRVADLRLTDYDHHYDLNLLKKIREIFKTENNLEKGIFKIIDYIINLSQIPDNLNYREFVENVKNFSKFPKKLHKAVSDSIRCIKKIIPTNKKKYIKRQLFFYHGYINRFKYYLQYKYYKKQYYILRRRISL